jgi:hypothetical protein
VSSHIRPGGFPRPPDPRPARSACHQCAGTAWCDGVWRGAARDGSEGVVVFGITRIGLVGAVAGGVENGRDDVFFKDVGGVGHIIGIDSEHMASPVAPNSCLRCSVLDPSISGACELTAVLAHTA